MNPPPPLPIVDAYNTQLNVSSEQLQSKNSISSGHISSRNLERFLIYQSAHWTWHEKKIDPKTKKYTNSNSHE